MLEEQQQHLVRHSNSSRTDGTEDDEGEDGTVRGADTEQAPTVDQGDDYDDEYEDQLQTPQMTVPIDTPHGEDDDLYDDDDGRTETRSKMGTATQRDYEEELGGFFFCR